MESRKTQTDAKKEKRKHLEANYFKKNDLMVGNISDETANQSSVKLLNFSTFMTERLTTSCLHRI